jgi:PAS domain S-box-containing protein
MVWAGLYEYGRRVASWITDRFSAAGDAAPMLAKRKRDLLCRVRRVRARFRKSSEAYTWDDSAPRLAAIMENSSDAIAGTRLDGVETSSSPGPAEIFGYRAEELTGLPNRKLIPAGRRDEEPALRDSEERLRFVAERAEVGYWDWDIGKDELNWTPLCKRLFGVPEEDEISYAKFLYAVHPEDRERTDRHVRACLESGGETDYDIDFRTVWPDGTIRWIHAKGSAVFLHGRPLRMAGIALDITDRRGTEDALRESDERLRLANEAAEIGTFTVDLEERAAYCSPQLSSMLGFPGVSVISVEAALRRVHREDVFRVSEGFEEAIAAKNGGNIKMDFRFVRPGGDVRWMSWIGRVDVKETPAGLKPFRIVGACLDITDRKRQEEHINFLMREVDHRAKNLLTLVQVIAHRTVAGSGPEFIKRFEERLRSLSASQDLLIKSAWKGISVRDLVLSQLAHFKDLIGTRITIGGSSVDVSAAAAQTLSMAIHELATNASKYGALSDDFGTVSIAWSVSGTGSEALFHMSWREAAGPLVQEPDKKGFGSTVVTHLVKRGLDADVEFNFAPTGAFWRISCPAANLLQ